MLCHSASGRTVSAFNTAVKIKKEEMDGYVSNGVLEKKPDSEEGRVTVGRLQTAGRHLNISICEFS